ncbi:MAG: ABC transporter substrate-binding protein [Treponema sp.]|nr:ABC transporter substrate-binding protein [Treponema sp.]MCI6892038.1 ABC transporter substrate-binding protein [Treponema sp.]MCI7565541.1 ABC transporter substrate-binding protein [Treponema sp.]
MKKTVLGTFFMLAAVTSMFAAKKNGTVRYLNFKPEVASIYQELAEAYEKETGVKVIVETAANNSYEATLTSKMATKQAPTLFQINGPRGYANWKNYCADLSKTELYKHLSDKSLAITSGGKVYGIPYVVEGYGIIYNSAITDKYFALPNKATKYKSMDEVKNFAALKDVCDDMQKNAAALGIKGVFASTSLKAGEDWRWQTHLANLPVYYEFKNNKIDLASDATKKINFQYDKEFKNIFDLYLTDSVIPAKNVGIKTVDNSMAEFALEECAMVQNGNWAWGQISGVSGNKVKAENVKYLPIYTGVDGEESQGLCIGTENFFCINKKASKADQEATADFIYWLYSSATGKKYVTNKLGFIAPFDTFSDSERPTDPLAVEISKWMSKPGITSVAWNFTLFPSQTFKDNFGASLLRYAQGSKTWAEVKESVVSDWAKESDM